MKLIALSLAMSLSFLGCQQEGEEHIVPVRPVLWTTLTPQSAPDIVLVGTVEPEVKTNHAFRVPGLLITRDISIGDTVTQGQVIASLDTTTFELSIRSAQASVTMAEAQLKNAETEEIRVRALLAVDATTAVFHDVAKQQLVAAQSQLSSATATLSKAKEQMGYAHITAEHSGVVIYISTEIGETVSPGLPVVTIASTDLREVVIDLPDTISANLPVGSDAIIALERDLSIQTLGKISETDPTADSLSRTVRARIRLENPPYTFRLGATVIITFQSTAPQIIEVPNTALLTKNGNTYVLTINHDNTSVSQRIVTLGRQGSGTTEVLSGITAGERIAVAGANSLEDNQKIRLGEEQTF